MDNNLPEGIEAAPKELPNVFKYLDFRKYLLEFYLFKKTKSSAFSFRMFARRCAMNSPNYMKLIIDGKRSMPSEKVKIVAEACGMSREETRYFVALVNWNQCKNALGKETFWKELLEAAPHEAAYEINQGQIRVLTNWYCIAIMEMILLKDFQLDAEWIRKRFRYRLNAHEIQRALTSLTELGFIEKVGDRFQLKNQIHVTKNDIPSGLIQMFHANVARAGIESLSTVDVLMREFSASTVAIALSDVPRVKAEIRKFHQTILQMTAKTENPEEVFQLNVQFFPLTHKSGGQK